MKEKYHFRKAQDSDAEALDVLVNSAYRGESSRKGWTTEADLLGGQRTDPQGIRQLIQERESVILLFEKDQAILACVHLKKKDENTCYFGMFTVSPDLQKQGIGKTLMKEAEIFAKNNWHCRLMEMTVITLRTELMNWYLKHGYEKTKEMRDFPYGDDRFGLPLRGDLKMLVLRKSL